MADTGGAGAIAPQGGSCVPGSNDVIDRLKADSRALASDGIPALLELAIARSPGSHSEGSVLIELIRRMRQINPSGGGIQVRKGLQQPG